MQWCDAIPAVRKAQCGVIPGGHLSTASSRPAATEPGPSRRLRRGASATERRATAARTSAVARPAPAPPKVTPSRSVALAPLVGLLVSGNTGRFGGDGAKRRRRRRSSRAPTESAGMTRCDRPASLCGSPWG